MLATFIHDGHRLDHIPTADLPMGAVVVLGSMIGVAHRPIPAGSLGGLAVDGVWDFPVAPSLVMPAWAGVWWNPATGELTNDGAIAGVVRAGVLTRALTGTEPTARVLLNR